MFKRILAVSVVGLAVGLAACDNRQQEQAQEPSNAPTREQAAPTPAPQQGTTAPSGQSGQSEQSTPQSQPGAPGGSQPER